MLQWTITHRPALRLLSRKCIRYSGPSDVVHYVVRRINVVRLAIQRYSGLCLMVHYDVCRINVVQHNSGLCVMVHYDVCRMNVVRLAIQRNSGLWVMVHCNPRSIAANF